jgi:hypothetical protein
VMFGSRGRDQLFERRQRVVDAHSAAVIASSNSS